MNDVFYIWVGPAYDDVHSAWIHRPGTAHNPSNQSQFERPSSTATYDFDVQEQDMSHTITTINPATGLVLATYEGWNWARIDQAVTAARDAAASWGQQPLEVRTAGVRRLADELRRQRDSFAQLITTEMGKPLAEAAGELEKSAVTAAYYADNASPRSMRC